MPMFGDVTSWIEIRVYTYTSAGDNGFLETWPVGMLVGNREDTNP
jgi:hypothetical protein